MEDINELIEKTNKAIEVYNNKFEDDETMPNDLLVYAENVIRKQKGLIRRLISELEQQVILNITKGVKSPSENIVNKGVIL